MSTRHGERAFFFVIVTVFLDMMAFAVVVPVLPFLLSELLARPVEDVVPWGGYLSMTFAVANLIAQPILGGLSDRFGRRPVLLASMLMLAIDFTIMGFATSIEVLLLGRALSGLASATHSTAAAYIADTTEPKDRGRAFGMLGAAFGLGFILGPAIGGLLGDVGPRAPFFVAAGLAALNVVYGVLVLPESLAPEHRRPFDLRRSNTLGTLLRFVRQPGLALLLGALATYQLGHWVFPATWSWHGEIRYGWDPTQIGLSLAAVGVASSIFQGALVGPISRRLGTERSIAVGGICAVIALIGYGFADDPRLVWVIIPIGAVAGLVGPALQQVMSSRVSRDAQGELQGAVASVQALITVLAPGLYTQCLFWFSRKEGPIFFPGAGFLFAAAMTLIAAVPLRLGLARTRTESP